MTLRAVIWCAVSTKEQAKDDRNSLQSQERDALAVCEREGWRVVEVLCVPGHSRRARRIDELAAEMRSKGIIAFDRLIELWKQKGFDVLVCRDDDRFARSQSIHAYIIEETIERGARIYTLQNGWIDRANFRGRIALGGYKAAGEIDALIKRTRDGIDKKIQQGLPNTRAAFPYIVLRDPHTGKRLKTEVDEQYRPILDDLATIVLSGVPFQEFEYHLLGLGHRQFSRNFFRKRLLTPFWWGNTGHRYEGNMGLWAFDPAIVPPDGAVIYYGNHDPVYRGDTADEIKAELRRRVTIVTGRMRPANPFRFSKVAFCGECGSTLSGMRRTRSVRWACFNRFASKAAMLRPCEQVGYVRDDTILDYVDGLLRQIVKGAPIDWFDLEQADRTESELSQLERQIDTLERQIEGMIINQATAPDSTRPIYDQQITSAAQRLEQVTARRTKVLSEGTRHTHALDMQRVTVELIRQKGVDWLWQQSDRVVNQTLHKLLGNYRLVTRDKAVTGVKIPPQMRGR